MRLALLAAAIGLLLAGGATAAPAPGPLIALSRQTGKVLPFPRVEGRDVHVIVEDDSGGWFIGGEFSSIGSVKCKNLAHIRADGSVDAKWCPQPNSAVQALALAKGVLYVGGYAISRIGGAPRNHLAALDARSGRILAWNVGTTGEVYGLGVDELTSQLFVSGYFSRLGSVKRSNFGAIDLRTGKVTPFTPEPDETRQGDSVLGFYPGADGVYAWGLFTRIGGRAVTPGTLVRLNPFTGRALPWPGAPTCVLSVVHAALGSFYVGRSAACEGRPLLAFDFRFRPVTLHADTPPGWVEAVGADPLLIAGATSADAFDYSKPRTLFAVDPATGRRLFVSKVHAPSRVWTIDVSGRLILVGSALPG